MVIVVFEVSGNWRICSFRPAIAPTSRMSRLTTLASTGRRMKRSVKAFIGASSRLRSHGGRWQSRRLIDPDGGVGLKLDLSGGHHLLARLNPFLDRDPLAARRADFHEPALDDEPARDWRGRLRGRRAGGCSPARSSGLSRGGRPLHYEHVVAVEAVDDRGPRQR